MKTKAVLSAKQLTPLIEMIIALAFFTVTSTILAQLFARAHKDSRFAHDMNNATLFVAECAEKIRSAGAYGAVPDLLGHEGFEAGGGEHVYHAYLDGGFSPVAADEAYATVTFAFVVKETAAGRLLTGQFVCIRKDGKELAGIEAAVFFTGAKDAGA